MCLVNTFYDFNEFLKNVEDFITATCFYLYGQQYFFEKIAVRYELNGWDNGVVSPEYNKNNLSGKIPTSPLFIFLCPSGN
jgi:hypothetical protein